MKAFFVKYKSLILFPIIVFIAMSMFLFIPSVFFNGSAGYIPTPSNINVDIKRVLLISTYITISSSIAHAFFFIFDKAMTKDPDTGERAVVKKLRIYIIKLLRNEH